MEYVKVLIIVLFFHSEIKAQQWRQLQKVVASDREVENRFGFRGGAIEGDVIALGGYLNSTDSLGNNYINKAGAIYIFEKDSSGYWNETQKIVHSDRNTQDILGINVKLHQGVLAAQSWNGYAGTGSQFHLRSGSIYLFEKNAQGNYIEFQKIAVSDRQDEDQLGESLELAVFEGNQLIIPCPFQDLDSVSSNLLLDAGAVYVFEKNVNGYYVETQKINSSDREAGDYFGNVNVSGNLMVVGAPSESHDSSGLNYLQFSGSAYVFEKNSQGKWTEIQKITADVRHSFSNFGIYTEIVDSLIVVGARHEDYDSMNSNPLTAAGAIYTFEKKSNGIWIQKQKISRSGRNAGDQFGSNWFYSDSVLYVGCGYCDYDSTGSYNLDAGASILFELTPSGLLKETSMITPTPRFSNEFFGVGDISGNTMVYGVAFNPYNSKGQAYKKDAGAAYIFTKCPEVISEEHYSICLGDSIFIMGQFRKNNGLYIDSFTTSIGCDSLRYYFVDVDSINSSIYLLDSVLYASDTNVSYQWFDCQNNQPLVGDTNFYFIPSQNGSYAVQVTDGGCTDQSDCIEITFLGLSNENGENGLFEMFPNPAYSALNIKFLNKNFNKYEIVDLSGKIVLMNKFEPTNLLSIFLGDIDNGIYLLKLFMGDQVIAKQLVKN